MATRPVLVALRALGLGDLLTAVPALRALGRAFPTHRRVLLAPAFLEPLVRLVQPRWELAPLEGKDGLDERAPLPMAGPVDVAVNLHGQGPYSHALLRRLSPARLIAFRHPNVPGTASMPRPPASAHERERWCGLLRAAGIPADAGDFALPRPDTPAPVGGPDVTLVHVGAAASSRRWPLDRWAVVADAERRAGRRVYCTGSAAERAAALAVARWAGLPDGHALAGRTDVASLAATVAAAGRLLSTDTGVAHVAFAFGTPSVVLYGPVSPARWGPPADGARHVSLWAGREGDPLADTPDPGLLRIRPGEVLAALARLDASAGGDGVRLEATG